MDNQPIQLPEINVTPDQPAPVDLATPTQLQGNKVLPATVASSRASKASFGLNKDYDQLHQAISSGNEDGARAASAVDVDKDRSRQLATGAITLDQYVGHGPTKPQSVFEKYYADAFVRPFTDTSNDFVNSTFMSDATRMIPDQVKQTANTTSDFVAKIELLRTAAENMQSVAKQQGWPMYLTQLAAGMVPFARQLSLRGQVPGTSTNPLGAFNPWGQLGENEVEQSKAFYRLPLDEAQKTVENITKGLEKNPSLAADFLNKMINMSDDDRIQDDIFGVMDIASIAGPISAALRARVGLFNNVRSAGRDIAETSVHATGAQEPTLDPDIANWENEGGAPARQPVAAVAAAARGDLQEAAIQTVAQNMKEDLAGTSNATQRSLEAVTSDLRTDALNILKNPSKRPGRAAQELTNRIHEETTGFQVDVAQALSTAQRVNRTPILDTAKDIARAVVQKIKDTYKGIDSAVLDARRVHDDITNTNHYEHVIGKPDATMFTDKAEAEGIAKLNGLVKKSSGTNWGRQARLSRMIKSAQERLLEEPTEAASALESEGGRSPREKIEANIAAWQKEINAPATEGYEVKQEGNGFYISYTKPLDENMQIKDKNGNNVHILYGGGILTNNKTVPSIWSKDWWTTSRRQKTLEEGQTPYLGDQNSLNLMKSWVGWYRTGMETLSEEESIQRTTAAHGTNVLRKPAIKAFKKINNLNPFQWRDLDRVLKLAQDTYDDAGNRGVFFDGISQLEDAYLRYNRRMPEPSEVSAYFAFKNNAAYDLALRRIAMYIPKSRIGAEQHAFSFIGADGKHIPTDFFEGITHPGLPQGDDNVMFLGDTLEQSKIRAGNAMPAKLRKDEAAAVREGRRKVIEVIDPDLPTKWNRQGQDRIRYLVVNADAPSKPLDLLGQVPRRGGGHLTPDYEHYGKQADVLESKVQGKTSNIYRGDKTLMPFLERRTGQIVLKKFNEVRELIHEGKDEEAKVKFDTIKFAEEKPVSWKEFKSWFDESRHPETGEKVPARFTTREPFTLVSKDKKIIDVDNSLEKRYENKNFVNGTKTGSLARTFQVEFTGERDAHELKTINDVGSRNNPVFSYEPAKLVDPIRAQNRGLHRIINSTYMNDVKIHSMTHWLQDAQKWLDVKDNELWHSPFYYFNKFQDSDLRGNTPPQVRNILRQNHANIQSFLGVQSKIDTELHAFAQDLSDDIHGAAGPKIVPRNALSTLKDPLQFINSIANDVFIGAASVKQFFTQATTVTNVLAISPRSAYASSFGSMLHAFSTINASPEILSHLDMMATKMTFPGMRRYKPGEWLEARQASIDSGFLKIGEDHPFMSDYPAGARLVQSGTAKILDWGLLPFKVGAKSVRTTAYHTAYLEFREANPTGRLTAMNKQKILARAADLDHNMSREANSRAHTGAMSIPGKFFAYDLRLGELMWGKRLTPMEKARMLVGSSILYGIPVGTLGFPGFAAEEWVRKEMVKDYGYVTGNHPYLSTLMDGVPALIGAAISSHAGWDPKYGDWYNFSKFGSQGIGYISDLLYSDEPMWKMLTGAVGSMGTGIIKYTSHLRAALLPQMLGGQDGYKFKNSDMLDALDILSSGSQFNKARIAFNTGKWISNNGVPLNDVDVSKTKAIFMATTGVTDRTYLDTFLKTQSDKEQTKHENDIINFATQDYVRYLQALKDNDTEQAKDYYNRTFSVLKGPGGVPLEKIPQIVSRMSRGNESLMKEVDRAFVKDAPQGKGPERLQQYQDTLGIRSVKEGSQ